MAELLVGYSDGPQGLRLDRANRHGVIAGATGTGKTATLQTLAEQFSAAGVPVFAADVKGDLSGIGLPGAGSPKLLERAATIGVDYVPSAAPVVFWDLYGERGHPIRATVSEMGPVLLSRLLELNDTQEGVMTIAFHVADEQGLLLLDLKDLQSMLRHLGENAAEISRTYGNVAPATLGAIQRKLLSLSTGGGEEFFGEPALRLADLMRVDRDGRGYVNVLSAERLISSPRLYSTFLLWLLSELFEELPEVGDPDKPKLVFFFDEAHLLFRDAPRALLEKVEQVVRLIRSKGVGIYFVTQNPADIPDTVLAQLGNRVQHALRAYTPGDQKGLRAAAQSFRVNPAFATAETIQALGVGEALVSTLDERGAPSVTQRCLIRPPMSRLGPATEAEREALRAKSPLAGVYDTSVDRDSAHELLRIRAEEQADVEADAARAERQESRPVPSPSPTRRAAPRRARQTTAEVFTSSLVRTVASSLGRELMRGLLGGMRRR
jgi:DNA helicase HerA-like ATPase